MPQSNTTATVHSPAARRAAQADPPPAIDGWELVEPVYEGPLARTYRAQPAGSPADRPAAYAFKLLRREWWAEPEAVALLAREALVGQTVLHRHLISVLAASVRRAPYYLVTPWLDGETLAAQLGREPTVELPVALWIARQVAEALEALDEAGWTHNDVKPSNIFISPGGHVTLLDLGFAARRDETGSAASRRRPVMGTCRYIAPEAITSALATDIRSDIYSLGAVLFEMLSGRPPFSAGNLAELARQHRETRAPDLRRLVPHLPREVSQLVARMLAKQPLRRPQNPAELVDQLAALEISTFAERSL
jgi:serine/threonine-protein kinase